MSELSHKHCCELPVSGTPPLSSAEAHKFLRDVPDWELLDNGRRIQRHCKFHDFVTAWKFADSVAHLAEEQDHHPQICFGWGYCTVSLQTDAINGLHENDFIVAAKVDDLANEPAFAQELRV